MSFFHSRIFWITIMIQALGPISFSFGDWANIIQFLSGFGMAYALWDYITNHKPELDALKKQITHLHEKHDLLHEILKED